MPQNGKMCENTLKLLDRCAKLRKMVGNLF